MAKRQVKERPVKMTRKYQSRVAQEQRQLRYIRIGIGTVVGIIVLLILAGLFKTRVADPAATRSAKEELKTLPAVTVNETVISIADWQARVRFERQMYINQAAQISQQLSLFDPTTEFGQQVISQGQAQIQQIQNELGLGEGIATDVLDQMVEEQLIRQEAGRRGITITPEELQRYIEVDLFAYPYPPTAEPVATLPPPTLSPTATVTPQPTLTPTTPPTPRSRQDFETSYQEYTQQVQDIAEMSEEMWRSMVQGQLYREKLFEIFATEVATNVQQIQGRYIVAQDQQTADGFMVRLSAGESFEKLAEEVEADQSEEPAAVTGRFDWSPAATIQSRFGEELAKIALNTSAGQYAREVITGSDGQFYLVLVEGNETRALEGYYIEQQQQEEFQSWLDQQKQGEGVVYGDWRPYIPLEPSLSSS